jgi:outer membrane protein OmpA-like peptidoglycan-associated protein
MLNFNVVFSMTPNAPKLMKIVITGILTFIIWSGASTYWYVYKIKDLSDVGVVTLTVEASDEKIPALIPEEPTEVLVKNPGIFTLKSEFDHAGFIEEKTLAPFLEQMTKYMDQNVDSQVMIRGHTDILGSKEYNQILSLKRANGVRYFLKNHGIPEAKMQVQGKGEDDPAADNSTDEGRALNRRITIEIN